mgnify:CR=1 FL=1
MSLRKGVYARRPEPTSDRLPPIVHTLECILQQGIEVFVREGGVIRVPLRESNKKNEIIDLKQEQLKLNEKL